MSRPMAKRYDSFLIRWWGLANEPRVEVEHIQSGDRGRFASIAVALAWISAHRGQRPDAGADGVTNREG